MRDLNFNHLRYFWAVAHEGNLTRAAQRMHLSQSSLSTQIRKLERQIGHRLFERQGRKLILTEAGQIALDYADTVFEAGNEFLSTLRGSPTARRQVLRIGALTTLSRNFQVEFLRPLIGRIDVELVVRSGNMRELLTQLETHAIDAILSNVAVQRDVNATVRNHLLAEQPVSLVARKGRFRGKFKFPKDVDKLPLVLPGPDSGLRHSFDRVVELSGVKPNVLAEVDDMAMLRLLARESGEPTLVPPIVVQDELKSGHLVELCQLPDLKERFYAVVQKRRFPNPLLATLIPAGR